MHEVVRGGLVGDEIGPHAAPHQLGQHLGRIAEQPDRHRAAGLRVARDALERVVEVACLLVEVAVAQAELDAALLALDHERAGAREASRQRLRAAHAAEPAVRIQRPVQSPP